MKQILVMIAAMVLVGCGEFKEGFKKGFDRQKKAAEARVAAEKKAAEAAKTPQQTKATPEKLIADPIVEKKIRRQLKKPEGELTEADLEKVTQLVFGGTKITDVGLKEVAKLKNLDRLYLNAETQITDAGLKEIAEMQNLTWLGLHDTKITDAGLKEVAKLQKLRTLNLYNTQITDAGLKDIAKLQKLDDLALGETKITDEGAAWLRKALPKLEIFYHSYKKD